MKTATPTETDELPDPFEVKEGQHSLTVKVTRATDGSVEYYFRMKQGRVTKKATSRNPEEITRMASVYLKSLGKGALVDPTIDPVTFAYYRNCEAKLEGRCALHEAVAFYLEHQIEEKFTSTVEQVVDAFYNEKKNEKRDDQTDAYSPRYLSTIRSMLKNKLVDRFGQRRFVSLTMDEVNEWLRDSSEFGKASYAKSAHVMCNVLASWARKAGRYAPTNIDHAFQLATPPKASLEREPEIITPGDLRKLLIAAVKGTDQRLTATIAIKAFAGIRDSEVARIRWDMVDFDEENAILLDRKHTKTKKGRRIPLSHQLRGWLKYVKENLVERGGTKKRDLDRVGRPFFHGAIRELRATMDHEIDMPQNCLRHSFVTYSRVRGDSAADVAAIAGHSTYMSETSYMTNAKKRDAAAYFDITIESILAEIAGVPYVPKLKVVEGQAA